MTDNLELIKFIRLYLGQTNWEYAKKTSDDDLKLFQKYSKDIEKLDRSYLVLGTEELLKKFKAFFLTRCIKKRPLYAQYSMYDYATELSSVTKDDGGLNVDMDLVFLYRHKHQMVTDKAEDWLVETVLNKVANRNRDGLVTVILSEISMPTLETSGELEVVNLSGVAMSNRKEDVLKRIKSEGTSSSSGTVYN